MRSPDTRAAAARRGGGFSLIEALFAGVLILVVMVAVLPLFTRSAIDNVSGKESTIASTHGRWTLEELIQLPLDRLQLTVEAGNTEEEACAAWDADLKQWQTYTCGDALPAGTQWRRASNLRQFSVSDLLDDGRLDSPVAGGTPPEFVHIRELGVVIQGERSGPLGPRRTMDLVTTRGF